MPYGLVPNGYIINLKLKINLTENSPIKVQYPPEWEKINTEWFLAKDDTAARLYYIGQNI